MKLRLFFGALDYLEGAQCNGLRQAAYSCKRTEAIDLKSGIMIQLHRKRAKNKPFSGFSCFSHGGRKNNKCLHIPTAHQVLINQRRCTECGHPVHRYENAAERPAPFVHPLIKSGSITPLRHVLATTPPRSSASNSSALWISGSASAESTSSSAFSKMSFPPFVKFLIASRNS